MVFKMLNRVYVYLFIITLISCVLSSLPTSHYSINNNNIPLMVKEPLISQAYIPSFNATNIKEIMTISPMFTPDNALDIHVGWINRANTSIILQNQYITKFDSGDWISDSNPLVRALVAAHNRSINIRVQVREDSDSDDITSYFNNLGIDIRWMGSQDNNPDNDWLSSTHNKLIVVDNKVTLLSSINFGENAFTENREAGFAIININVANYFTTIFNRDWNDGVDPSNTIPIKSKGKFVGKPDDKENFIASSYPSHTNIPKANFTGIYNMTLFTNPDSADETIFKYLLSAKESIYVSMYTISRPDFNNTLIDLKKNNPNIDIQVLISNRRFGESENIDTKNAAISLVNNLIPVYNSTTDANKVNGYYHAKYWIIDGKHVFVYSGNWSPRSVTPQKNEYTSTEANRDMGIAVHNAPDIADFFKSVWESDIAVGSAWDLPIGVFQTSFTHAEVISGIVSLNAQSIGLENPTLSYRWGTSEWVEVSSSESSFSIQYDTTALENGIQSFEVKASNNSNVFFDKVTVNIANYHSSDNWRFLITELLPDPTDVSDAEGEYIELTNSFPFDLLIENWKIGDNNILLTFPYNYTIPAYSSIIIAKSLAGYNNAYGNVGDFQLGFTLVNTGGDYVQLIDPLGKFYDVVAYGIPAPDGSEQLSIPGSGQAILRKMLHIDTNKASDFIFGSPDPKGSVPLIPLKTKNDTTNETPLYFPIIFSSVLILAYLRRNLK